jgi:hypothetical protein
MANNSTTEDYLEVDKSIPGQNYACISFVSPEKVLKQKEMFMFHKFMTQKCAEWEKSIDEITKKASDELKNKIDRDLKSKLKLELKYTYDQFKGTFDDFTYKFNTELQTAFDKQTDFQTNVRGVKVRGVYNTYDEAQTRAKVLQRMDRSFHVYVGQVGYWLPFDPTADHVDNEEYLEEELNTLMKEYKDNEVRKDIFYEEQKREKTQDAVKQRLEAEAKQKAELENTQSSMEEEDPWMKSKFSDAQEGAKVEEITEEAPAANAEEAPAANAEEAPAVEEAPATDAPVTKE